MEPVILNSTKSRESGSAGLMREPWFQLPTRTSTLYQGDALKLLSECESESIDLIFADPPYFLSSGGLTCQGGKSVSVNKGEWDSSRTISEVHDFNLRWLAQCQRVLKPNGTIFVSGTSHNIYSVGFALQTLGFKILNDIAWFKINPPPNLSCRYFTHSTETLIWAAKSKSSKHVFNYDVMREMPDPAVGKQMLSLWRIKPPSTREKRFGKHPTQKPEELLSRIILAASNYGDTILDPFTGGGTTAIAALTHGRKFIGFELESDYLNIAVKRITDLSNVLATQTCGDLK